MKKNGLILLIINAVCLLNACSDEDYVLKHDSPVVDYVLPSFMKLGTEVVIPGNGFSSKAELYLKNEAEEMIRIMPEKIVNRGFSFKVPEDLPKGFYTVILRQEGDWELGNVRVIEEYIKQKRLKAINYDMGGFVLPFTLTYDEQGRLSTFYSEFYGDYHLSYGENRIDVVDNLMESSFSFNLQDGKIISSMEYGETSDWLYEDGYLINAAGNGYTYENGNLLITDNDMMAIAYEYTDNKLINSGLLDITACCMYVNYSITGMEFIASLLNMSGKHSVNLPTALPGFGNFTYKYENNDPTGNVTRLILAAEFTAMDLTFVYETAEIFL